jgi:hypothetical protein
VSSRRKVGLPVVRRVAATDQRFARSCADTQGYERSPVHHERFAAADLWVFDPNASNRHEASPRSGRYVGARRIDTPSQATTRPIIRSTRGGDPSLRRRPSCKIRIAPNTVNTAPDTTATRPRALTKTLNTRQYPAPRLAIDDSPNSGRTARDRCRCGDSRSVRTNLPCLRLFAPILRFDDGHMPAPGPLLLPAAVDGCCAG